MTTKTRAELEFDCGVAPAPQRLIISNSLDWVPRSRGNAGFGYITEMVITTAIRQSHLRTMYRDMQLAIRRAVAACGSGSPEMSRTLGFARQRLSATLRGGRCGPTCFIVPTYFYIGGCEAFPESFLGCRGRKNRVDSLTTRAREAIRTSSVSK